VSQAVTRTLKITYGAITVDGSGAYYINGPWSLQKTYEGGRVEATVAVAETTAALLQTACAALEAAFRKPRQALTVEVDGVTQVSADPGSANTGFNAEPSIGKAGDPGDGSLLRIYRIAVAFELPADLTGQGGRRTASVLVDQDASNRRRITARGRYTVIPGGSSGARAQFLAQFSTYRAALIAGGGGGGTYDTIDLTATSDDADKNCDFSFLLQEDLYSPTGAGLTHASIRGASIHYVAADPNPGDSPQVTVRRLRRVMASIDCAVDATVSTDLDGLWTGQVLPYLIAQAKLKFGASGAAKIDEHRDFDRTQNRIVATVVLDCVVSGASTIRLDVTIEVWNHYGKTRIPAYADDPLAKYVFQGPARRVRTTTSVETKLGLWSVTADGEGFAGGGGGGTGPWVPGAGGGGYSREESRRSALQRRMGVDSTIDVTDCFTLVVEEWANDPGRGSGGGGPTPTTPSEPGPFQSPGGAGPGSRTPTTPTNVRGPGAGGS